MSNYFEGYSHSNNEAEGDKKTLKASMEEVGVKNFKERLEGSGYISMSQQQEDRGVEQLSGKYIDLGRSSSSVEYATLDEIAKYIGSEKAAEIEKTVLYYDEVLRNIRNPQPLDLTKGASEEMLRAEEYDWESYENEIREIENEKRLKTQIAIERISEAKVIIHESANEVYSKESGDKIYSSSFGVKYFSEGVECEIGKIEKEVNTQPHHAGNTHITWRNIQLTIPQGDFAVLGSSFNKPSVILSNTNKMDEK